MESRSTACFELTKKGVQEQLSYAVCVYGNLRCCSHPKEKYPCEYSIAATAPMMPALRYHIVFV
jgi:hypothetical protein